MKFLLFILFINLVFANVLKSAADLISKAKSTVYHMKINY